MNAALHRIEPQTPGAAALIAALQQQCFSERWAPSSVAEILAMPGAFCFVASNGEVPAGFSLCRCAGDECEILSIGVADTARRRGIGGQLLRASLAHAESHGACRMFLEVAAGNAAARGLYERHSFEPVGLRVAYYKHPQQPPADALILARRLEPAAADTGSS